MDERKDVASSATGGQAVDRRGGSGAPGSVRQKIFDGLGWLAFALLLPPVLAMFGLPRVQELATERLRGWGSAPALLGYFYALHFLRVFFGSDQRYAPVILGYAASFLWFSNSLDIGFMAWLRDLAHRTPLLSYDAISLVAGVGTVFLANALSRFQRMRWIGDVVVLVVLPAAGALAAATWLPGLLGF